MKSVGLVQSTVYNQGGSNGGASRDTVRNGLTGNFIDCRDNVRGQVDRNSETPTNSKWKIYKKPKFRTKTKTLSDAKCEFDAEHV